MWAIKRWFILTLGFSRRWVRATPAPGRLVCTDVSMISPGHTGPPLACEPDNPFTATQAWWPPPHLSSALSLPHLCRSSLWLLLEKRWQVHQRIDSAAWEGIEREPQCLGRLQQCAVDSALKPQKKRTPKEAERKGTLVPFTMNGNQGLDTLTPFACL